MAEGPQALKKDPLSEIAAPRGGLFFWCCPMTYLFLHPSSLLYALPRKSQAVRGKFTDRKGLPSVAGHYCFRKNQTLLVPRGPDRHASASPFGSNGDDRRQRRKQGGAVGAAASRMQATAKQTLGAATRAVAAKQTERARMLPERLSPTQANTSTTKQ